ncbi:Spy/CpxP family protein refolding chaperone [Desulfosudis oleivorans]|uniref:Periplasmic heavy metal sensor n=1 Tax=Desulfosudis oleivorans (strain DSM 6200 / JCM 39069 / Hxd3) TaxID=96561 RepID=A8ZXY5_DESOH|nr:periplasmic heavy metal sensor [Desulfosudis oleivorans]ABW68612.1 hypothetical protein Dole_2809 [Desulfosudis oleivorans Hxd3]
MKKRALTAVVALFVMALATYGFAWGPDRSGDCPRFRGQGAEEGANARSPWKSDLTEEQQKALDGLNQKFIDDTVDLRISINTASDKLALLMETSKPDRQQIKKLVKEISELKGKLAEKHVDYLMEAREIAPEAGKRFGVGKGACGFGFQGRSPGPGLCRN